MEETKDLIESNIVVDRAKVLCNYARKATRLTVEENDNGSNVTGPYIIATEKDCKIGENLFPYQRCYSPYFMSAVNMLYGELSDEYYKYRSDYADRGYGECFHLLEEIWFQADEKVVVSNMYNMERRLLKQRELHDDTEGEILIIRPLIRELKREIMPILDEKKGTGYCYDILLYSRYREREGILTKIVDRINDKLLEIEQDAVDFGLVEEAELTGDEFLDNYNSMRGKVSVIYDEIRSLVKEYTWDIGPIDPDITLAGASDALDPSAENPERTPKMIVADVASLTSYITAEHIIYKLLSDLKQIIAKIHDWTTNYSRILTTDSFMVCRCGGLLQFESSGQEVVEYFSYLYARTLELVIAYKNRYVFLEETQDLYGFTDEKDELKYSYRKAIDGLERTYTYLSEGIVDDEEMRCNVHLEFVAKSVKEEELQYLTALITVGGFVPGQAGTVCGAIAAAMSVYNMGKYVVAKISSDGDTEIDYSLVDGAKDGVFIIDGAESVIKNTFNAIGVKVPNPIDVGLEANSVLSKVLNAFALLTLINYEINDNWVESIRIYIFTEEHMFYADQFLNETCEKVGDPRFLPSIIHTN